MARRSRTRWQERLARAARRPRRHPLRARRALRGIEVVEAAHPVPDAAGRRRRRAACSTWCRGSARRPRALPHVRRRLRPAAPRRPTGLTLEDKQAVNRALLHSGAHINEMNCVRKHLSAIKGGRLAAAFAGTGRHARDLRRAGRRPVGDRLRPDRPRSDHVRRRARRCSRNTASPNPQAVIEHLERAARRRRRSPAIRGFPRERGDGRHGAGRARAAAEVARKAGVAPVILGDAIEGEAREVAKVHGGHRAPGRALRGEDGRWAPPCVLLSGGETTVTVRGSGRGGRNAEFLLALAVALDGHAGIVAIAADTDGIDGSEDNAGALLAPDSLARAAAQHVNAKHSLAANDGHGFFAALGDLSSPGRRSPTSTTSARSSSGSRRARPIGPLEMPHDCADPTLRAADLGPLRGAGQALRARRRPDPDLSLGRAAPRERARARLDARGRHERAARRRRQLRRALRGRAPGSPRLVLGSHLDTVRNAGKYDGMLGVVAGIECVARAQRARRAAAVRGRGGGFADEEGVRFNATLLGSRAVAGTFDAGGARRGRRHGMSMREALRRFDLDPERIGEAAKRQEDVLAYAELHIEQGPVLEAEGLPVGVVTAINGANRYAVEIDGMAGHAGTVPMTLRQDALGGARPNASSPSSGARARKPELVGTVGQARGAAGRGRTSSRARCGSRSTSAARATASRLAAAADLVRELQAICARRGVSSRSRTTHEGKTAPVRRLAAGADRRGDRGRRAGRCASSRAARATTAWR